MSDDDEVLFEGSDLCKYLIDHGYSDFASLSRSSNRDNTSTKPFENSNTKPQSYLSYGTQQTFDVSKSCFPSKVPISDYNKLLNVLQSQLLFKEDTDILESMLSATFVYKKNVSLYSCVSLGVGGLCLSMVPFLKSKVSYYIPVCFTVLCSTVSSWLFYLKYIESHENKLFSAHVSLLRNLCSNIHRVFRSLKETEIISTGQVSNNNIGVTAYSRLPIGFVFHNSKELDSLPSWKTLPQLRKCLMNVLIVTIKLLNEACETLKDTSEPMIINHMSETLEIKNYLKTIDEMLSANQCISFKSLQSLIDIYLAVQSEYLKWIGLSICNNCNIKSNHSRRKGFFTMISYLQSNLDIMSSKLISQYHNQNSSAITKSNHKVAKQNVVKHIGLSNLQVEIHNISLLMLSILLRVRSLEDSLGEISETEAPSEVNTNVSKQLASLKDDLTCVLKCYDTIYHRLVSDDRIMSRQEENKVVKSNDVSEPISKKTGIIVGVSDFNVNSPDEVFLAISGNSNQGQDSFLDDWLYETQPQLPNNLIEELCKTLKSRKAHFSEREKLALERQGLQDIQDCTESSSSDECWKKETKKKRTTPKTNKGVIQLHHNESSCSEDDDSLDLLRKRITEENISYKKLNAGSTSDSEKSCTDDVLGISPNHSINNASLANMIAKKSQMWRKTEEENYSDG